MKATFPLALIAVLAVGPLLADDAPPARPNIILVLADDIGYEGLSSNGSKSYRTPNLDRLAKTGARFQHCYSQPLCTPSRVQIMTGKYNYRNYTNFGKLRTDQVTFANILEKAGYDTAIAGKWQLGGDSETVRGFGFDTHCLWHLVGRQSRYWEPKIVQDGVEITDRVKDRFGPDVFCDFLLAFIEKKRDAPFFVYYPMALPHWPFVPTPDSNSGGRDTGRSRTRSGKYDGRKGGEEYFPDMVAYIDKLVGRIEEKLESQGLREKTLLLFTADNGTAINIVSRLGDREIRGGKAFMTDAGTHVPLVANWKGVIAPGQVSDRLVDFTDFLPTIVQAAGAKLPEGLTPDGHSFLPHLRGESAPEREWVLCHYNPRPKRAPRNAGKRKTLLAQLVREREAKKLGRFVRNRRFKLFDDGRFYDIAEDVDEVRPLKAENLSEELTSIRARFQRVLDELPEWQPFRRDADVP